MKRFVELVNFAREHSPYYNELYKDVPFGCEDISAYPIVDQKTFWEANENHGNGVLTSEHTSGIVFKSGGTSGNPKYSYFTANEWDNFTKVSGSGFRKNGVKKGDKIANLFYSGELYASFIYITDSIKSADIGICYPIAGQTPIPVIVEMLQKLQINVIAGVPTTIVNMVDYLQKNPQIDLKIDLILFGGEPFYEDQINLVKTALKDVKIHSILYASVDGGELGYFDEQTCQNGEHRVFDESTIMEIVDEESGEVIEDEGVGGKLLVTNLNRHLMPLIRYPVGDLAMWSEPKGSVDRKFRLLGRSQEGARIGPATLYVQDIQDILKFFQDEVLIVNFQLVITHQDYKDKALIKIAPVHMPKEPDILSKKIIEHLYKQREMFKELLENNIIHPVSVQWCTTDELTSNARTGKTKHILDNRLVK